MNSIHFTSRKFRSNGSVMFWKSFSAMQIRATRGSACFAKGARASRRRRLSTFRRFVARRSANRHWNQATPRHPQAASGYLTTPRIKSQVAERKAGSYIILGELPSCRGLADSPTLADWLQNGGGSSFGLAVELHPMRRSQSCHCAERVLSDTAECNVLSTSSSRLRTFTVALEVCPQRQCWRRRRE